MSRQVLEEALRFIREAPLDPDAHNWIHEWRAQVAKDLAKAISEFE